MQLIVIWNELSDKDLKLKNAHKNWIKSIRTMQMEISYLLSGGNEDYLKAYFKTHSFKIIIQAGHSQGLSFY